MDLWVAAVIVVAAAAVSAAGMLVVRRRAPAGTYFKDVAPAGALYTVVGTAYMVIVAFVFFIAFESYHSAKLDAQDEATATLAMFHAAEPLSAKARRQLQSDAMCYAREVISKEWPAMRKGTTSPAVEAWVAAMESDAEKVPITGPKETAAFEEWSALNGERRKGRQGRIAEASPLVPPLIWFILTVGAVIVVATVCFFADAEEARLPQGAMIAAVATIVVSGLLLVRFLATPYANKSGSIKPTAMARSVALMQQAHEIGGDHQPLTPCA